MLMSLIKRDTWFDLSISINYIGPGCSSVGYGATQEIGPFLVANKGNSFQFNPFAWNHGIPNFI